MIQLHVTQVFGRIGLEIRQASFELRQEPPDLEVRQFPADFVIEETKPELEIDYTARLEALGGGGIESLSRLWAREVQAGYLSNLEKTIQVGNEIGAIEKRLTIGEVVFAELFPPEKDLELVPLPPINITYTPGSLKLKSELGKTEVRLDYGSVTVENFVSPAVKVFLEQEPYVKIKAVGQAIDLKK